MVIKCELVCRRGGRWMAAAGRNGDGSGDVVSVRKRVGRRLFGRLRVSLSEVLDRENGWHLYKRLPSPVPDRLASAAGVVRAASLAAWGMPRCAPDYLCPYPCLIISEQLLVFALCQ